MMRRPDIGIAVFALLVGGCGPTILLDDDAGPSSDDGPPATGTTTVGPTTLPPPMPTTSTTSTTTPPGDGSTTEVDDTNFIPPSPDGGGPDCGIFEQDCPPGEKCMPWANDGGNSWNSTRCSPIADNPGAPGDPCTVEGGPTSGLDDCELAAMCWDVDPQTNEGTCVAMCVGDESSPMCEEDNHSCQGSNGPIWICLPHCDPIGQDCPEGQACYPVNGEFICAPDASGEMGTAGDPCEFINVCDEGHLCIDGQLVPGCEAQPGCCTAFCQTDDPMPPCLEGQICEPYFEPGTAPPGYELVGACVLP